MVSSRFMQVLTKLKSISLAYIFFLSLSPLSLSFGNKAHLTQSKTNEQVKNLKVQNQQHLTDERQSKKIR